MSNMKNGLSTLNRWLGRKHKADKDAPNGKLSKSNTNLSLSVSTTNINETSQLEYNRITPLPMVTSNAPFEQTFRITVLLPKEQLYVARLGARVPLSKLLELVSENKLLDADKYEFRDPGDPGKVYSLDLTIGAVGLSEIRLCHKSDSYDSFNTDEVMKLHRTHVIRDSLSSSELSSRISKHTLKTTSPCSSNNSLNSMDSTGMNYTRTPVSPPPALPTTPQPKMAPPPRKKRAAPRPPSQIAIPEKSALALNGTADSEAEQSLTNGHELANGSIQSSDSLPRKNYFVSTPNLSSTTAASHNESNGIDCNGNAMRSVCENNNQSPGALNGHAENQRDEQTQVQQKNARNLCGGSVQNLASPSAEMAHEFPEPSPRKRLIQIKKKSAPAPPPRNSLYMEDGSSIHSGNASTPNHSDVEEAPVTPTKQQSSMAMSSESQQQMSPQPRARETTAADAKPLQASTPVLESATEVASMETTQPALEAPKPVPRVTTSSSNTSSTLLNATNESSLSTPLTTIAENPNVSKVMLNRTPTPEPRSLSAEPPESDSGLGAHINDLHNGTALEDDDAVSKQADSGIGEPVPSPIPDSLPSEGSAHECKSTFESSSDDDDMVKTYNFKLGKTLVKPLPTPKTLEELTALAGAQTDSGSNTPATLTHESTPNISDTTSWNFAIPISPPPNFADAKFMENVQVEKAPDTPITPKINERPVLNFDSLSTESATARAPEQVDRGVTTKEMALKVEKGKAQKPEKLDAVPATPTTPLPSPTAPLNEIVEELSAIISDNRMDTLIRKPEEQSPIEAAKPNTLTNFSIATITQQPTKPAEIERHNATAASIEADASKLDGDKLYQKHEHNASSNAPKQSKSAVRAESFHSTATQTSSAKVSDAPACENALNSRSSSHMSLSKLEQSGLNLNRRRSSSELSIGESPTLQSPEVVKTILNSRKNSLENNGDAVSKTANSDDTANANSERRASNEYTKLTSIELKPKSRESVEKSEPAAANKPKELPKVYRYSGPPNINFSTWSERPKAQVAIKNEGDYIFGGKNADKQCAAVTTAAMEMHNTNSVPRNHRVSTPAGTFRTEASVNNPPAVAPKPTSPIKRMGIPEKDFHVPVVVKPLRDVTVEHVELRTAVHNSAPVQTAAAKTHKPAGVTTVMLNGTADTGAEVTEPLTKQTYTQSSSTLPRVSSNRFSTTAQLTVGPALLRSTSITQLEAKKPASEEAPAAPFGQGTLRRTGLKEKILAKEAAEAKVGATNINAPTPNTVTVQHKKSTTTTTITNNNGCVNITTNSSNSNNNNNTQSPATTKTLQSAKLELKLQKTSNVYLNQSSAAAAKQPSTLKSAPVFGVSTPPPPPPPMGATLRSMSQRNGNGNGSAATTPTNGDPRDQMLEAIRNFKREMLNRV